MPKKNGFTPLEKDAGSNSSLNRTCKANKSFRVPLVNTRVFRGTLTGFTLVEILIALTILGIGLIAVMAYLPTALDASKRAADITTAALIAQKHIEEIKLAGNNDITAVDGYDTSGIYHEDSDVSGFFYMITVSSPGALGLRDVSVNIRWIFKGKYYVETFSTMIAKYDPN